MNVESLQREFADDCILLTGEAAVYYATGFYTTARRPKQIGLTAALLLGGRKLFVIPRKWERQIAEQKLLHAGELVAYENTKEAFRACICELLQENRSAWKRLWVELEELDVPTYRMLCTLHCEMLDVTEPLAKVRLMKSADEITALKKAADVAVQAMEYAKTVVKPGMTELEAVAEIEHFMRKRGSDGVPFTMKLLSGEKSAVVTEVPGNKVMEPGELVLLDFGAKCGGYSSDWTRTFCLGEPRKEQQMLYDLVWRIERECIKMVRPGLPMAALVKRAYEIAGSHPYGEYFQPHLGHSVGITSHEAPVIEPGVKAVLAAQMVITIEPGIYIPGIGGVRIEDEILVTENGYEILTGLRKEGLSLEE